MPGPHRLLRTVQWAFWGLVASAMTVPTQPTSARPLENPLHTIIESLPPELAALASKPEHEVQILYTAIDRDEANVPRFATHRWNVDRTRYFYPASTVKLPVALLALEKLAQLDVTGLNRDTIMLTDKAEPWQTVSHEDASSANRKPSIGHYVRKICLVSDNDAYNRLFEWVGMKAINESLASKGYGEAAIVTRLSVSTPANGGCHGNPIRFVDPATHSLLHKQAASICQPDYGHGHDVRKGRAHLYKGRLIQAPMSFADKNFLPLDTQAEILQSILFPQAVHASGRFQLDRE